MGPSSAASAAIAADSAPASRMSAARNATRRPSTDRQKQGLDGAMQTILAQPFGKFLLTAAALGFVVFGVFAILQSRYRRM